jgi:hypothetical protein
MEASMSNHNIALPKLVERARPILAPRDAELILPHMRGACVTKGATVHMLFRVTGGRADQKHLKESQAG